MNEAYLWGFDGFLPNGAGIVFGSPIVTFEGDDLVYYTPGLAQSDVEWKKENLEEVWEVDDYLRFPKGIPIDEGQGVVVVGRAMWIEHERSEFPEEWMFRKLPGGVYYYRKCTLDEWRTLYDAHVHGHRWFPDLDDKAAYIRRQEAYREQIKKEYG